jgi:predicted MPP superfamily phosphohydrolase
MPRILFPITLALIVLGLDIYVFSGYKSVFNYYFPKNWTLFKWAYWTLSIVLIAGLIGSFVFYNPKERNLFFTFLTSAIFIIFAVKLLFAAFLILDDVVRLVRWMFQGAQGKSDGSSGITRLQFIIQTGALLGGGLGAGLFYGITRGSHRYRVINKRIKIKNLPKAFEGFRVLQISDIHSGSFWNKNAVKRGIDLIKEQHADVVFFTGDLVNNDADEMEDYKDVFREITAPYGVYATLGNHDYGEYSRDYVPEDFPKNVAKMQALHQELGWDLLMNESRYLEKDGEKIAVLGIENWGAKGRFPKYGKMVEAVQGVEADTVQLLLSHDPSHWREEVLKEYPNVDLTLSGHTHGFQFGIELAGFKLSPSSLVYKEWAGLYADKSGQQLYVNRGFGYLGFPGRLGIWPEITVLELVS